MAIVLYYHVPLYIILSIIADSIVVTIFTKITEYNNFIPLETIFEIIIQINGISRTNVINKYPPLIIYIGNSSSQIFNNSKKLKPIPSYTSSINPKNKYGKRNDNIFAKIITIDVIIIFRKIFILFIIQIKVISITIVDIIIHGNIVMGFFVNQIHELFAYIDVVENINKKTNGKILNILNIFSPYIYNIIHFSNNVNRHFA
ncbi:MAG: hypothetical protein LBI28_10265 [Treponema sp.]|nr:hypothetical protein [Treponema sp.]